MNLIIIPTFNRSYKLRRVLEFYSSYVPSFGVIILDASDEKEHQENNQATADLYSSFASRITTPNQRDIVSRLINFLEEIDEEFVAIGTDEDPFFPEFLEVAFDYLHNNPDYVAATGRYITSARPLLGFRRVSFWTDSFIGLSVDENESALRVINFQRLNSGGVPPIFWSVRRKSAFLKSMMLGKRLTHASAQEFLDQINTCVMGKILISDMPMLLRDESRLDYVRENNRDEGTLYIGERDLREIINISKESWENEVTLAVKAAASWYVPKKCGESYQSRQNSRIYCRFNPTPEVHSNRSLRWLQNAINWSCVLGNLLSQGFAYFYFLRYMVLKGKGRIFMKMSKTVPVNK